MSSAKWQRNYRGPGQRFGWLMERRGGRGMPQAASASCSWQFVKGRWIDELSISREAEAAEEEEFEYEAHLAFCQPIKSRCQTFRYVFPIYYTSSLN